MGSLRLGETVTDEDQIEVGMVFWGEEDFTEYACVVQRIEDTEIFYWYYGLSPSEYNTERDDLYRTIETIIGWKWTLIDHVEPCSLSEQVPVTRKRHLIERR